MGAHRASTSFPANLTHASNEEEPQEHSTAHPLIISALETRSRAASGQGKPSFVHGLESVRLSVGGFSFLRELFGPLFDWPKAGRPGMDAGQTNAMCIMI